MRLTSEARNARAIWTLDGTSVTYGSTVGGNENLHVRPADGSGPAVRLIQSPHLQFAAAWSPSDQALVFVESSPDTATDIMLLPASGERQPRPLVRSRFAEAYPDVSPDGRWLAFASNESNRSEVYVQPYPGPGPRQQVSVDGGTAPAWSRDGRELFYTTTQAFGATAGIRSYDVTADGRRFLMVQPKERPPVAADEMILVQNWLEELKTRVSAR